jgi:hypothetical protein
MYHPFEAIPERWRGRILAPLVVLALALSGWLTYRNVELMNPASPAGIWSLSLARDGYGARVIIDTWEMLRPEAPRVDTVEGVVQQAPASPVDAAIGLVSARFLLIFLYVAPLSLACAWVAGPSGMPVAGFSLSIGVWAAALLHAIENTALLRMLLTRDPGNGEAVMASTCFSARMVMLALIVTWLGWAWRRGRVAD